MTAVTAVFPTGAKSVGVGEARPPGVAKYKATTESELAESAGEFPVVAKSVGKVRQVRPPADEEVDPIWHGCHCRELHI